MNRRIALLLVLLLTPALTGCLVTARNDERRTGNYVADTTFNQIQPGSTTAGWVEATLGKPDTKSDTGTGSEVWKWNYTETRDSSGSVFLLFAGSGRQEKSGSAFVEFRDGVVVKKWRG